MIPPTLSLDYDVRPVAVTITLTLNGQPFPSDAGRGHVVFSDSPSNRNYVPLAQTGAATVTALLLPGTYDVLYASGSLPAMPRGTARLASRMVVSAASTSLFDLKTTTVSGTVIFDGQPIPANNLGRGYIRFGESAGPSGVPNTFDGLASVAFSLGNSGPTTYSGLIFAGTQDVVLTLQAADRVVLARGISITTPATRNDDVQLASASGTVTFDGLVLPDAGAFLGSIEFFEPVTGSNSFVTLSPAGTFTQRLLPGTWDAYLNSYEVGPSPLPLGRTRLATGLVMGAGTSTTRAFDAQAIDLSVTVTFNGQPFPPANSDQERGVLWFHEREGNVERSIRLPLTGPATISARLFEGVYDIGYQAPVNQLSALPATRRVPLVRGRTLSGSTTLNLNLETVAVDLSLSISGQPRINNEWQGSVFLEDDVGGYLFVTFPSAGPAQAVTPVYKGVPYDVSAGVSGSAAPTTGALRLRREVVFTGDTTLALDLPTLVAAGTITANGSPLAAAPRDRGGVDLVGYGGGPIESFPFGLSGPVSLSTRRPAIPLDVWYHADQEALLTGYPFRLISRACMAQSCRTTSQNLTGTWDMTVLGYLGGVNKLRLVEGPGGAIGGQLSDTYFYVFVDRGLRVGDQVTVMFDSDNPMRLTARLESPCRMTGVMEIFGYDTREFSAIR